MDLDSSIPENPVIRAILQRRSTRLGYLDEPVDPGMIETILTCGLAAPSSKNAQPWKFHVVTERAVLDAMANAMASHRGAIEYVPHDPRTGRPYPRYSTTVRASAAVLRAAGAAIFVENLGIFSGGRTTLAAAAPPALTGSLVGYGLELLGLGAAIENMWLAATALGLGAAFMGDVVIAEDLIAQRLDVDGDVIGVLCLARIDTNFPQPPPADIPSDHVRVVWH